MEAERVVLWLKNNWVATLVALAVLLFVGAPILKRWYAVTGYVAEHPAIHEKTDQKIDGLVETVSEVKGDVSGLKSDVSELKSDVSELKSDVSGLKSDVSGLKSDVSELKGDVSELKGDVSELRGNVSEIRGTMYTLLLRSELTPAVSRTSPVSLTEYGKKLSEGIGARAIIQGHLDQIYRVFESQDITNVYKLQAFCLNQLDWSSVLTEEELDLVDRIAYTESTDRVNVLAVLSVAARDVLLARKGWEKGETDWHQS